MLELGSPLVILGAVAQQADARRGDAAACVSGIVTAHDRRTAAGIPACSRRWRPQSMSMTPASPFGSTGASAARRMPWMRLTMQRGAGEQCAGAAGGDDRVALAVTQHVERDRHGSVLLAAGSRAGVVVHGDDFARVGMISTLVPASSAQAGLNRGALADEHDLRAQLLLRVHRALDDRHPGRGRRPLRPQ